MSDTSEPTTPTSKWKTWGGIALFVVLTLKVIFFATGGSHKTEVAAETAPAPAHAAAPAAQSSTYRVCYTQPQFQGMVANAATIIGGPQSNPDMLKIVAMDSIIVTMTRHNVGPCDDWKDWWDQNIDAIRSNPIYRKTEAMMRD